MVKEVAEENGEEIDNWKEFLNDTPSTFPDEVLNYYD